jgi:hypothetical protein
MPLHIVPKDDLIHHEMEGENCPCGPRIEHTTSGKLVIHSSLDGRELTEQGSSSA